MVRGILLLLLVVSGVVSGPGVPGAQQREEPPRAIPPIVLPSSPRVPTSRPTPDTGAARPAFLPLTLSEGEVRQEAPPVGVPEPLATDTVATLLTRLPRSFGDSSSRPPPAWEPTALAVSRTRPSGQSLRVVSVLPSGETDLAPYVTVVFSRPMVRLGLDGRPIAGTPPAHLDPEPPGKWRWLDVRTLRFEPDTGRLPGATRYTLTVRRGIRSVDGSAFRGAYETSFSTAGPRAIGGYPNRLGRGEAGLSDLDPVILLVFDQRVDPQTVLGAAHLVVADTVRQVRMIEASELDSVDARLSEAAARAGDSFWVALRPTRSLPPGTAGVLTLDPGLRSLEGPLPAGRTQELRFRVRGAFEVMGSACETAERPCEQSGVWAAFFSHDPDPTQPLSQLVRVEPAVEGLHADASRSSLFLFGEFRPHTTYRIRLLPGLRDRFGQTLGRAVELEAHIGAPASYVRIPGAPFVVMDPSARHRLQVVARGVPEVEVTAYRVRPADWKRYRAELERRKRGFRWQWRPDGEPVTRWTVPVEGSGARFAEVSLDLSRVFRGGTGHALVMVDGRSAGSRDSTSWGLYDPLRDVAWIQATSFAVGAAWDPGELVGWAISLEDGRSLEGVHISLPAAGEGASTNARGLARIPLGEATDSLLVARRGTEVALLPWLEIGWRGRPWVRDPGFPQPVWFSLTDRGLYRPGEALEGHGWIRSLSGDPRDLAYPTDIDSVRWEVRSANNRLATHGAVPVSATGSFHVVATLPADMHSGWARLELTAESDGRPVPQWKGQVGFQVEEFRRPAYEVKGALDPGPYLPGDTLEARATATYYDGAALQGSRVSWRVRSYLGGWAPPGWSGWSVGPSILGAGPDGPGNWTLEGETDALGGHALRIVAGRPTRPYPARVQVDVQVTDLDRQAGSAGMGAVVLPADRLVAIRRQRFWVEAGGELSFDAAVVDPSGAPVPSAVPTVSAFLEPDSNRVGSADVEMPVPVACAPAAEGRIADHDVRPLHCSLRPREPGTYRIHAEVTDEAGRESATELEAWVLSAESPWAWQPAGEGFALTPDRQSYQPGDTARLMVAAPYYPVRGLLTVARHGIRTVEPVRIDAPGLVLRIPIRDADAGGMFVRLDVAASAGGQDPLTAQTTLQVAVDARRLHVEVSPDRDVVGPGDSVSVEIAVTDAAGEPSARGDVAVWLVDEAVLALGSYRLQDPLSTLERLEYRSRPSLFLPQEAVRWERRALGPGIVSGKVLDAITGRPPGALRVWVDDIDRGYAQGGRLLVRDLSPGEHRLTLLRPSLASTGVDTLLDRTVRVPKGGLDLGTILVERSAPEALNRFRGQALALNGVVARAAALSYSVGDLPPPVELPPIPPGADVGPNEERVAVRTLFRALAAFVPSVELDERGSATVKVRLPDTMTRYRIMVVASEGPRRFGTGESHVSATKDLVARASPPRLLHPGDAPELPVIVQNASERATEVRVVARARGMLLEGERGYRVRLPAGGRAELRFRARAVTPGQAALQVLAVARNGSGESTDAMEAVIPVRPALAPRAVAVHRQLAAGRSMRLEVETPPDAYPGFGGVEVGLSTSLLQPLVEVVRSLCLAPFYTPEPTIARVIGLASLDGSLESLKAPDLPSPTEIRTLTASDVDHLVEWIKPYLYGRLHTASTSVGLSELDLVHAAHALSVAAQAGYDVPEHFDRLTGSLLKQIWQEEVARLKEEAGTRALTGWDVAVAAYALDVGVQLKAIGPGPDVAAWLGGLEPADLPVEVLAWLLGPAARLQDGGALRDRFLHELENRALTTGATVTFRQGERASATSQELDVRRMILASDRRSDAAVLLALMETAPDHPFIPGLVRGLLGQRDGSPLGGAHENGWVMLALGRYAATREATSPDLTVRTRLGGKTLGEVAHLSDTKRAATAEAALPAPGRPTALDVAAEGRGTLHVRAAVLYAPVVTRDMPAQDRGFLVSRRYEAVDAPDDVRRAEDGTWRVRAGARVRVRITFTAPARRYQVRLRDPLPAGLEVVNPRLQGVGFTDDTVGRSGFSPPWGEVSAPLAATLFNGPYGWDWTDFLFRWRAWQGRWAAYEELRDDRMDASTPYLPAGTYETTYLVRATTPGTFLAPPARVEEAEHPETFGQGTLDEVVVVPGS